MANTFGPYVADELIGSGATGKVWRAHHGQTMEPVALKVLRGGLGSDPADKDRLLAEGRVLAGRELPGCVRLHEVVVDGDDVALVMDLVDGTDLRRLIAEGPLAPALAAEIGSQVASALAGAHLQGLIHRDVKPENVLLTPEGAAHPTALLSDFGLARDTTSSSATRSHSQLVGTPHYVAPDVIGGAKATSACDVYSLGVVLYEMVMGWRPFRSSLPATLMQQHLAEFPRHPGGFPESLWEVVAACLAKAGTDRPTAIAVAEQLTAAAPGLVGVAALPPTAPPVEQTPTTAWRRPQAEQPVAPRRRRTPALAAVAVSALLAGGVGGYALLRPDTTVILTTAESPTSVLVGPSSPTTSAALSVAPSTGATPVSSPVQPAALPLVPAQGQDHPVAPETGRGVEAPARVTAPAPPPPASPAPRPVRSCPTKTASGQFDTGASFTVSFNSCGDGRVYIHRFDVTAGKQTLLVTPVLRRTDTKTRGTTTSWQTGSGSGPTCPCTIQANKTMTWGPDRQFGSEVKKWAYVAWSPGQRAYIDSSLVEIW